MFLKSKKLKLILKIFCALSVSILVFIVFPLQTKPAQALIACPSGYTCQNITGFSDEALSAIDCMVTDNCDASGGVCCRPRSTGETGGETTPASDKYGLEEAAGTALSKTSISVRVSTMIRAIVGFVGVIFLLLMIYGGLTWMTAGGNEEKVGKAKKIIVNSTIGIVIVMLSYAITYYIIQTVTGA